MAAGLLSDLPRATDSDGNPISGATWTFYDTNTSTLRAVYADDALGTSLGSTVTANSAGLFVPIYLNTAYRYRAVLKDAGGSTIRDIDPVNILDVAALLAANTGAGIVNTTYGNSVQANLDGYATRAAIKALTGHTGARAYLYETGREGWFTWDATVPIATHQADPGEGIYLAPNAGAIGAWVRLEGLRGPIQAKWFGVLSSNSDNSSAFQNINTYVAFRIRSSAGGYGTKVGTVIVDIHGGDFIVKSPKALHDGDAFGSETQGVTYRGLHRGATAIIYRPTTAGPLVNNTRVQDLRFYNIGFMGFAADDSSGDSNWMNSDRSSTYATQDFHAEDCLWRGRWRYGVELTGTNNNSEHTYIRCAWYDCRLTAWLYSGQPENIYPGSPASDQFLNYSFLHCKYWVCTGPWVDMAAGGNISIIDCDASAWGERSGDFPSAKYLFRLRGNTHAYGVQNFDINGLRMENKHENARVLWSQWGHGTITIRNLDTSSQVWVGGNTRTAENFRFEFSATGGPTVRFDSCGFQGKAKFEVDGSAYVGDVSVSYHNCFFYNVDRAYDYFVQSWETSPISYEMSLPEIKGYNCKFFNNGNASGHRHIANFTINPRTIGNATQTYVTTFTTPEGHLPFDAYNNSNKVRFPVGAVIRKFRVYAPAGHTAEAAARDFDLMDQNNAVIATVNTVVNVSAGFNVELVLDPPYEIPANGDILNVETDSVGISSLGRCEVEWTG